MIGDLLFLVIFTVAGTLVIRVAVNPIGMLSGWQYRSEKFSDNSGHSKVDNLRISN